MIKYKYNFFIDLKWGWRTIKNYRWLKSKNLKIFLPNPFKMAYLIIKKPKCPKINIKKNIICYWLSSGTWGAYTPPNKIFICPWKIHKIGGFEKIIKHEITHLQYEQDVKNMNHEEKEQYIMEKEKCSLDSRANSYNTKGI